MKVAVVVPWRGGQPDRERHHSYVKGYLRGLLPDAVHLDADSGHATFSRAGSRNHGVRLAAEQRADVVVLCDADTLPERDPLLAATRGVVDGRLHLPYTHFRGLSKLGTEDYLAGQPATECTFDMETDWSTGGCLVSTPEAWFRAGGMDERCTGYGFEDTIFRICADAVLGPTVKHGGTITHLWHPSAYDPADERYLAGAALARRFDEAEGDPDAVRALVAERQGVSA